MGDEELVRRVRQGDGNSADELVARHYAAVLRYCAWHCRDAATAEDLTQETFLHVFRGFSRYAERGRFRAYLYTCLLYTSFISAKARRPTRCGCFPWAAL